MAADSPAGRQAASFDTLPTLSPEVRRLSLHKSHLSLPAVGVRVYSDRRSERLKTPSSYPPRNSYP